MSRILAADEICPDGVPILIPWHRFTPGTSVFIPCINSEAAIREFGRTAKEHGYTYIHKIVVEDSILGVRFWRTT